MTVHDMRTEIVKDSLRRAYVDARVTLMTAGIDEVSAEMACRDALDQLREDLAPRIVEPYGVIRDPEN